MERMTGYLAEWGERERERDKTILEALELILR